MPSLRIPASIHTSCDICARHSITLEYHEFKQKPNHFDLTTGQVVKNPNYLRATVCSTDRNLLNKVSKINPTKTPQEIFDIARAYRRINPIAANVRPAKTDIKPAKVIHFQDVSYCAQCGNRMSTVLVSGLNVTKCTNNLCPSNL